MKYTDHEGRVETNPSEISAVQTRSNPGTHCLSRQSCPQLRLFGVAVAVLMVFNAVWGAAAVQASENFWTSPASQTYTQSSANSLLGTQDLTASSFSSQSLDGGGRLIKQQSVIVSQQLSDSSALSFEYADAQDQRNFMLGYTANKLSVSYMAGSGEDFAHLSGEYAGLDPYMFHAGYRQRFKVSGYALDYAFRRFGHVQMGQAVVEADGLQDRRARYMEWSNDSIFARATEFARGSENIGSGFDLGFAFGRNKDKLIAMQAMELDHNRSMKRIRFQFKARNSRQYWLDVASHSNPLYSANDDLRVMFNFKTHLGASTLARYQNDEVTSGDVVGESADDAAIEDENGSSKETKKKKGKGWKRAVFIGAGIGAAAALSSSGSSNTDVLGRFRTQTEAAFEVLNRINPQSIRLNREFGGWVYVNMDGSYTSTTAVEGEAAMVTLPARALVIPAGSRATASYHTHAAFDPRFDNENFSPQDLESDRAANVDGYLATPGGQFKFHDVASGTITTLGTVATD